MTVANVRAHQQTARPSSRHGRAGGTRRACPRAASQGERPAARWHTRRKPRKPWIMRSSGSKDGAAGRWLISPASKPDARRRVAPVIGRWTWTGAACGLLVAMLPQKMAPMGRNRNSANTANVCMKSTSAKVFKKEEHVGDDHCEVRIGCVVEPFDEIPRNDETAACDSGTLVVESHGNPLRN